MAMGAADIRILATGRRRPDLTPLARVMGLAEASLAGLGYGTGRVQLVEADDPDSLGEELWQLERRPGTAMPASFLPMGDKLGLMKLALRQLHAAAPEPAHVIRLPPGAPFGRVRIDTAGCTLCLACTSVCPTGALAADPDHPRLSFTENACVQCGLCKPTCPEKVIELVPQFDFTEAAFRAETIKEEEPALCTRCGKPFGVKSTIDRVAAKLAGRHWMYQGDRSQIERLGMCADCRVIAQSETALDPYAGPERPRTKGAEDYRG